MTYKKYKLNLEEKLSYLLKEYKKTPTEEIKSEGIKTRAELNEMKRIGELNWMVNFIKNMKPRVGNLTDEQIFR